jgi:hypothetical protein
VVNYPADLIAVIPTLAPGTYQVRIVQYTGGKPLKTSYTATFDRNLRVVWVETNPSRQRLRNVLGCRKAPKPPGKKVFRGEREVLGLP